MVGYMPCGRASCSAIMALSRVGPKLFAEEHQSSRTRLCTAQAHGEFYSVTVEVPACFAADKLLVHWSSNIVNISAKTSETL